MKNLTSILTFVFVIFMLNACSDSTTSDKPNTNDAKDAVEAVKSAADKVVTPAMELAIPANPKWAESEIPCADAKQMIAKYKELRKGKNNTQNFVNGFQLNHGDLEALLKDTDMENVHHIYAMFGAREDSGKTVFELIFFIKESANATQYRYFDFTKPCPTLCPTSITATPRKLNEVNDKGFWFGRADMTAALEKGLENTVYLLFGENSGGKFNFTGNPNDGIIFMVDDNNVLSKDAYFAPCENDPEKCPEINCK